ncbi:max-binding protein MNT [Asbolus verrucosus]|uniref:Max-binding protein MNT n=1 Tax=Asbolus verrucosus TaxID=1661398 RepID=A0A482VIS8_ASBVE|nr:max-binding protein MNT [Asbolus verrucosus]
MSIFQFVKMSLSTLLEAAKFLEMQEQQEQQQRVAEAATSKSSPSQSQKSSHLSTVLITSSEIAPNLLTLAQETVKKQPQAEQQQVVSSTVNHPRQRVLHNSFDIMNPLVIDEASGASEVKRKQPPLVFRAGTREVHNKLEKHRRAHLKECFDVLKKQLPQTQDEKKTSNLSILHSALRCIQSLKRKERELEHEMERLARDKIAAQQKLAVLKKDISSHYDNVDFSKILPEVMPATAAHNSVGTEEVKLEPVSSTSQNGERIQIPLLPNKTQLSIATSQVGTIKEVTQQPVQTTALSVLPVGYPVSQGLVLQKLAIVPKGLTELTPLVSTHFITQQQINGKVVPVVNAQYVVKPVVVVSRPS